MLGKIWCSHKEFQLQRVIIAQVLFRLQKIDSVESIIAPTFANFEFRLKFSCDFSAWLTDHLDTIFVLLCFGRSAFLHLKKHRDIVTLSIGTITIGIHLKAPGDTIGKQRLRVDRIIWVSVVRKVLQIVSCVGKFRNKIRWKVNSNWLREPECGSLVDLLQLPDEFRRLPYQFWLRFIGQIIRHWLLKWVKLLYFSCHGSLLAQKIQ